MNILLITSNYPKYQDEPRGQSTFALHEMVLEWKKLGDQVVVLRVQHAPLKLLFGIGRAFEFRIIDGVTVVLIRLVRTYAVEDRNRNKIKRGLLLLLSRILYRPQRYARTLQAMGFIPDIILGHLDEGFILAASIKREYGVPLVYGIHESDVLYPHRTARYLSQADAVAFRSPALKRQYSFVPPGLPTFYALSGIEEELIRPESEVRAKWASDHRRILTVCRLDKKKNTDVTIRALATVRDLDNWSFDIIGRGAEREHLEELVRQLSLEDRVHFLGYKPRPQCLEEMRDSHFYVMPSAPETFGLVYLEALSQGMIVVGGEGWGVDGILKNNQNGYFVDPRDHQELAALLRKILTTPQDDTLTQSMAVIRNLTRQRTAEEYRTRLLQLVGDKGGHQATS